MIRFGRHNDIEKVNAIRQEVSALHANGEPENFKPGFSSEMAEYVGEFIDSDTKKLLVCEENGVICAYAMIEFVRKPETVYRYEQRYVDVKELGTLQIKQGKGYGKMILTEIKAITKQMGFSRVELNMWSFNNKALAFYEKMGFETFRRHLRIDV